MVTIQRLYEQLDELVEAADEAAEAFAESGDLSQLAIELAALGSRNFRMADAVNQIATAIDGSWAEAVGPAPSSE